MDISKRLSQRERDVIALLLEAARSREGGGTGATVIRIAGGWVRDKLLGLDNDDIDVALNDTCGHAFAQAVNARLKAKGVPTGTIGVIHANPDQSKHLETATVKVLGLPLDFVNLRSETYAQDSRIPEVQFGTPEEDAYRRDFTINALFYNANEGRVEDLTGHGIRDLARGIIRTPLPPDVTFFDDPLRVLRAVRFAARFGYDLAPSVTAAASSAAVHEALLSKVSRERVGKELEGMLDGKSARPAVALTLLQRLRLLPAVFGVPACLAVSVAPPLPEDKGRLWAEAARASRWMAWLLLQSRQASPPPSPRGSVGGGARPRSRSRSRSGSGSPRRGFAAAAEGGGGDGAAAMDEGSGEEEEGAMVGAATIARECKGSFSRVQRDHRVTFLAAALLPLRRWRAVVTKRGAPGGGDGKGHHHGSGGGGGGTGGGGGGGGHHHHQPPQHVRSGPLASYIVRDLIKLRAKDATDVATIHDSVDAFALLSRAAAAGAALDRVEAGMAVRGAGVLWRTGVHAACAEEVCALPGAPDLLSGNEPPAAVTDTLARYRRLASAIEGMGLAEAHTMRPLLDGKVLMRELGCKGPVVGHVMEAQTRWQLAHPGGAADDCLAAMRQWLAEHEGGGGGGGGAA